MKPKSLIVLAAVFATLAPLPAQTPSGPPPQESAIKSGDPAPALQVAEWVKGEPIKQFEPGKVYLVEFWATWCGPCILNIPHLNALQAKHAKDGLVVIGLTTPDLAAGQVTQRKENNSLQQVRAFVAKRTDMNYHVAYDTPDKATYLSMMGPKRSGIPYAFLFGRDGRLAADFHPYFLDDAIEKVLAGTWDPVEGPKDLRRSAMLLSQVATAKTYAEFQAQLAELEKDFPLLARKLIGMRFDRARLARDEKNFLPLARSLIAYSREKHDCAEIARMVVGQLRPRTPAPEREISADETPEVRRQLEAIAARTKQREEDEKTSLILPLDVLAEMADLACEISREEDFNALAAKAEVAFARGDIPTAIRLQTKAAELAAPYAKAAEEKRLAEFQAGRNG